MLMKDQNKKSETINTISGEAEYVGTEFENRFGRWNDNYTTAAGYYLIHEKDRHHVYKVIR